VSRHPFVTLSEILEENRDEVTVDPLSTYEMTGVLSFGRGLFRREAVSGAETSYTKFTRLHAGQFVYSRLFAWEGAVALVPDSFQGTFVSQEFPTFRVRRDRALPEYLDFVCRWPTLHERLAGLTKGLGLRRQRVHPEQLLSVAIPLPDLDEQGRLSARLGGSISQARQLDHLTQKANQLTEIVTDAAVQRILDQGVAKGWVLRPLEEVAEVNPKPARLEFDEPVSFVPMAAVEEETGSIAQPQERVAGDVQTGYKQFRRTDVIFARITPSMQNGKSAVADALPTEYAYGSTEFHVLRPSGEVSAEWIHRIVRTSRFREMAAERFTGTAGQQRVPASFLRSVEIPVPREVSEQAEVVKRIDEILGLRARTREARKAQGEKLRALVPSILNAAFSGSL
jgi:type I restriction enzyme S subunit